MSVQSFGPTAEMLDIGKFNFSYYPFSVFRQGLHCFRTCSILEFSENLLIGRTVVPLGLQSLRIIGI